VQLRALETKGVHRLENLVCWVVLEDAHRHDVAGNDGEDRSCRLDIDAAPRRGYEVQSDRVGTGSDHGDRIGWRPDPADLDEHAGDATGRLSRTVRRHLLVREERSSVDSRVLAADLTDEQSAKAVDRLLQLLDAWLAGMDPGVIHPAR
jgi:hypothetical protein